MAIEDNQEIRRTLQNLLPGTTYATRVRALNEFGQYSDWSEALQFTAAATGEAGYELFAPTAPTVQPQINAISVIMSYSGTIDGISNYKVYHSLDNVTFSLIATSPIGIYIHQVPPGTTHYYKFSVVDIYGTESPVSPSNSGQSVAAFSSKPYATVVVAAYDSSAEGKDNADFICDGEDDQITIAAAMDKAEEVTDGKVVLLEGNYSLTGRVDAYCATLEGQGVYATYISIENDLAGGGPILAAENIKGLWIDGGNHNYDMGIIEAYFSLSDCYIEAFKLDSGIIGIEAMWISNCWIWGISEMSGTLNTAVVSCYDGGSVANTYFDTCATTAVEINHDQIPVTGCVFDNCLLGVKFNASGVVTGSIFTDSDILVQSDDVVINGNRFDFASGSIANIAIKDLGDTVITGNHFKQCGVEVWGQGVTSSNFFYLQANNRAFFAKSGSVTSFSNNRIYHGSHVGAPGVPPIRVDNSVTGTLVSGNMITVYSVTGAFSDAGISTVYGAGNWVNGVWTLPAGAPGSDKHYTHEQISASATWTIVHNLNKFPAVITVDNSGVQMAGTVTYNNANQVTVTFAGTQTGKAYCN